NPRISKAARWLVEHHQGERWVSSEDTASVILALSEYLRLLARQNPSNLTATVSLNGASVATRRINRKNFFQEIIVPLPVETVRAGDEIIARVVVRAPRAAREVLVEDPIPAGCEIVDEGETEYDDEGQAARREVRDRRVVFHAFHVDPGDNVFEYRLRAELPG